MELEGKIWKDGKFWLVEVPALNLMTQGKTRKEALFMVKDAIMEYVNYYFVSKGFELAINDYDSLIGITSNNNNVLLALSLRKQREKSGSTVREVSQRLGSQSPNAYAQYEKAKKRLSLDKYEHLFHAANPKQTIQITIR